MTQDGDGARSDPDVWFAERGAAAEGHSGPVKHVLYLLCKEGLKQSTAESAGLSLSPDSTRKLRDFEEIVSRNLNPALWDFLRNMFWS